MFWLWNGHPHITPDDQLVQLVEHLTEDIGVSGRNHVWSAAFSQRAVEIYTAEIIYKRLITEKIDQYGGRRILSSD
jgi:hypothetical protein